MHVSVEKTIWSLQIGFNFALKNSKSETSLILLLFIFFYNKLCIRNEALRHKVYIWVMDRVCERVSE